MDFFGDIYIISIFKLEQIQYSIYRHLVAKVPKGIFHNDRSGIFVVSSAFALVTVNWCIGISRIGL